jgi:hypothetical protein
MWGNDRKNEIEVGERGREKNRLDLAAAAAANGRRRGEGDHLLLIHNCADMSHPPFPRIVVGRNNDIGTMNISCINI